MKKDDYKRFRIRTVPGADDYAMMAEVLRRRYGKALEEGGPLPDLVLLDGGRGQLNVGVRALEALGLDFVPIVSLAKREEEVYRPESLHPLVLDPASPALHTLQRIRDEAHRFAITYHKKLRQADPPVGPGPDPRHRADAAHEPPAHARLGAPRARGSVAELAAVPKVTPKLAQRIHEFFHPAPGPPGRGTGAGTGRGETRAGPIRAAGAQGVRMRLMVCSAAPPAGAAAARPSRLSAGRHRR